MKPRKLLTASLFPFLAVLLSACQTNMVVFEPQGPVARSILDLINWSLVWMLLVVVVVFGLFAVIVWKYREKPENQDYEPPEEHGNVWLEVIWTAIPILIILALTVPTVKSLYALEEKPQGMEDKKPITIHVTSADWKWIFSYPEQGIETVNYVNIPEDTPVLFKLTSASTMQSFWVPALAGQKYTMNKMETELYLAADHPGSYLGRNTNFNGQGYAGMEFEVLAQTQADFDAWVKEVQGTAPKLSESQYEELLKPTHLGRLTYSNTHLAWVDHAQPDSKSYLYPELYRGHSYPGKVFEDPQAEGTPTQPSTQHSGAANSSHPMTSGGEQHGH